MRRWHWIVVLLAVAVLLAASPFLGGLVLRIRDSNPVVEGLAEAQEEGCVNCHLPAGGAPIPNPGSRWGTVPVWGGGIMMMYVENDGEILEYIRKGQPDRKRKDPETARAYEAELVHMPAFGDRMSEGEIREVAICAKAASGKGAPSSGQAADGYNAAVQNGCFHCHEPAGYGGMTNAGSAAGVIAGWAGPGFHDLVRSQDEFREWVRTGLSKRMWKNPVARFFFKRQPIQMPAYEKVLKPEEIDAIWEYVQWLRGGPGFTSLETRPSDGKARR